MTQAIKSKSLYDRDILLWVEDTVNKLRARDFEHLDLENLIEEVTSLGISQKKELLSRLTTLLEHLLKRLYVISSNDYNGWERTIRNQRTELDILFSQVPSLKTEWQEKFDDSWRRSISKVKKEYRLVEFPLTWQYESDIEAILNTDFWEVES